MKLLLKITLLASVILGALAVIFDVVVPRDPRQKVIELAMTQLGEQDPDKYWSDVQPALMGSPHSIAWCGGFALWLLRQAGLTDWKWEIGKGFASRLPRTTSPRPGDIAYFDHLQHHAIVKNVNGDELTTIDGNQSPGEQVKERIRSIKEVTAFYSIEPLIVSKVLT
jgi:hypothetical protein